MNGTPPARAGFSAPPEHLVDPASGVLPLGLRAIGPEQYEIRAVLSDVGARPYPMDGRQRFDPQLCAQIVRQAGLYVLHGSLGVPMDFHIVLERLRFTEWEPIHDLAELAVRLDCTDIRRRGPRVDGLEYEVRIAADGREIGRGGARIGCLSPAVYRFVLAQRGAVGTRPRSARAGLVDPNLAGVTQVDQVLLATGDSGAWEVAPAPEALRFRSAPTDHIPGMVLMAAAGQAALATEGGSALAITGMDTTFLRYTDIAVPLTLSAARQSAGRVDIEGVQGGEPVLTAAVTFG